MRARAGRAVHGHVPDEQPGGRQRHAARRPLRQRRPRRSARRLRAGAVRLHRPGRRPAQRRRPRRPAAVDLRGRAAGLRLSCSTCSTGTPPWLRLAARHWATTGLDDDSTRSATEHRAAGRALRCRRSSPTRCSSGSTRQDGPWFAHARYLRPHPPYAAAGEFGRRMYDPADVPPPIADPGRCRHPLHDRMLAATEAAAPTDRGGDGAGCRRSTTG